jgi:hypothetical protein
MNKIIKERCNTIKGHGFKLSGKNLLMITKFNTELCTMKERNWITSLKARVWKLHGIKKGMGKGSCPLSLHTASFQHTVAMSGNKSEECNFV